MRAIQSGICGCSLALLLLGASVPAAAALGEDVSSVAVDSAQLQAKLDIASGARFDVHRMQLPSGITIREYVSPAGMVFAVSWQGPAMPDLRQILGRYFEAYVEAVKNRGAGSAPGTAQQPGLVVQTGGHMRAYFGRAYVLPMLPRGVSEVEIQ